MRPFSMRAALAVAAALFFWSALKAQNTQRSEAQNETAALVPDLTGVWNMRPSPITRYLLYSFAKDEPSMTPWAEEKFRANKPSFGPRASRDTNDPNYDCFPSGVPRVYLHPSPFEIFRATGRLIMFFEHDNIVRQIWIDGREHPKDLDPDVSQWFGDSVGKWEGDTLVVDTIGFNDKTWLDRGGTPHSDALHLVERMRRVDHNTLQIDITFDDPKAYTKPWSSQLVFNLKPGWKIDEHSCKNFPRPTE